MLGSLLDQIVIDRAAFSGAEGDGSNKDALIRLRKYLNNTENANEINLETIITTKLLQFAR